MDSWLADKEVATCPISDLGFLRVSTHPKALNAEMTTTRRLLGAFLKKHRPEFVADDLSPLESPAQKSEQVTDQYLAGLAAS